MTERKKPKPGWTKGKGPEPLKRMNERHAVFVEAYVAFPDASKAARAAGVADKSAKVTGCRWLKDPIIAHAVREKRDAVAREQHKTATEVVAEAMALGFANIGDVLEVDPETGHTRPIEFSRLTTAQTKSIQRVKMSSRTREDADGSRITTTDVELVLHDKIKALALAADMLGLKAAAKVELSGKLETQAAEPQGTEAEQLAKVQAEIAALEAAKAK